MSKTENIVNEDFKYIGGLANKKDYAFPTYAKAIKYLNGKFISICEALDIKSDINVFRNDNLVENKATASGFGDFPKGGGFSGEGNLEGNKELAIESEEEIPANPEDYKKQPGYIGVTEAEESEISDDSDLALESRVMSIANSIKKIDEAITSVLKKKL